MRQQRAKLGRLQRELERRQRQREGRPATGNKWNEDGRTFSGRTPSAGRGDSDN